MTVTTYGEDSIPFAAADDGATMTLEDPTGAFVDVCVLSEPRAHEMDFEMTQATHDMPRVRVVGTRSRWRRQCKQQSTALEESIEGHCRLPAHCIRRRSCPIRGAPRRDTDDATAIAWTKRFDEPIYGIRADGSLVADDGFHENITIGDIARSAGQFGNGRNDRVVLVAPTGLATPAFTTT